MPTDRTPGKIDFFFLSVCNINDVKQRTNRYACNDDAFIQYGKSKSGNDKRRNCIPSACVGTVSNVHAAMQLLHKRKRGVRWWTMQLLIVCWMRPFHCERNDRVHSPAIALGPFLSACTAHTVSQRCSECERRGEREPARARTTATENATLQMIYDCWPTGTRNRSWIKTNSRTEPYTLLFGWREEW